MTKTMTMGCTFVTNKGMDQGYDYGVHLRD